MPELRQSLTLFDVTMIAIGGTTGSGIFLTPSLIAQALPSPWLILAVWLVGGLMALAGALTFSELAGLMPRAGGQYVYLKEAYGSLVGFLFGWAYFLVVNAGGLGALSVAFATYLGYFVPLGPPGAKMVAIGGLLALTAVNVVGVKAGAIRRRLPDAPRTTRVPLYPLTPAFFVAVSAWFVSATLVERPAQAWAGLALLALGVPAYYSWKRRTV